MAAVIKFPHDEFDTEPALSSFEQLRAEIDSDVSRPHFAQIIEQAEQEARAIVLRAQEAGRQAGLDAQREVIDEQVADKMQLLDPLVHKLVEELTQARQSWLVGWDRS